MSGEFPMPSQEFKQDYTVDIVPLGTLDTLHIDAVGKIESEYTGESIDALAHEYAQTLSPIENNAVLACIDGRRVTQNADGSAYEVRAHQAGGDFAAAVTAILGGSSALPQHHENDTAIAAIYDAGRLTNRLCGLDRSSHLGGCGAANLAPKHLNAISHPAVQEAAIAVLELNKDYFDIDTQRIEDVVATVVNRATLLSDQLENEGWDGSAYTSRAERKNASGVEVLETADDATHGHHEQAILLIQDELSRTIDERKLNTMGLPDTFVIDLSASKRMAQQLASIRGQEGYTENIAANILWHIAVASQLCGKTMPVIQLNIS